MRETNVAHVKDVVETNAETFLSRTMYSLSFSFVSSSYGSMSVLQA